MPVSELIGKKYQYRLLKDEFKNIVDIQNDTVIFDDGGRVPLNRLDELFSAVDDNTYSPAQARQMLTQTPIEENLDPNKFFNNTHLDLLQKLKNEAEKIDVSKLPPQVNTTNTTITNTVPEPAVKKIIVETDDAGKVSSHEENAVPKSTDFLKKMKRNTEIEIIVKMVEKIPNLEFIKMMDENFDQGVLEYLIQDITEKFIASPNIVSAQVRQQLTSMIENGKPKKIKKEKVVKGKKVDSDQEKSSTSNQ